MTQVSDRITQAPACTVILLSEDEKDIYTGAGWKLANFDNGRLVALFDPESVDWNADTKAMTKAALDAVRAWMAERTGEFWLVMCSCYELCEPRMVSLSDAASMAHMAHVFGDQLNL